MFSYLRNPTDSSNLSYSPQSRSARAAFSVGEILMAVSIFLMCVLIGFSVLVSTREKARVLDCINNLRNVSNTLNFYKVQYTRFPQSPVNNFSGLAEFTTDYNIFSCPSTPADIQGVTSLNGNTSYRYFGTRRDLKNAELSYDVVSGVGFDPADPGKRWPESRKFGAVYDREYANHDDNCLNIIYLDDSHWERLCFLSAVADPFPAGVMGVPVGSGGDAVIIVIFSPDNLTAYAYSTKDLSNVVLLLEDGTHQKFEPLTGLTGTFSAVFPSAGMRLQAAWVKSGTNASGDGPGYGQKFNNPGFSGGTVTTTTVPPSKGKGG